MQPPQRPPTRAGHHRRAASAGPLFSARLGGFEPFAELSTEEDAKQRVGDSGGVGGVFGGTLQRGASDVVAMASLLSPPPSPPSPDAAPAETALLFGGRDDDSPSRERRVPRLTAHARACAAIALPRRVALAVVVLLVATCVSVPLIFDSVRGSAARVCSRGTEAARSDNRSGSAPPVFAACAGGDG
jgi:hypothetical protein